ncbi:hypothetical protein HDU88_000002 [Geranomyces variabilis]|nr:hypothetical protein HDU88_000002 [Geranomyces variabilis]
MTPNDPAPANGSSKGSKPLSTLVTTSNAAAETPSRAPLHMITNDAGPVSDGSSVPSTGTGPQPQTSGNVHEPRKQRGKGPGDQASPKRKGGPKKGKGAQAAKTSSTPAHIAASDITPVPMPLEASIPAPALGKGNPLSATLAMPMQIEDGILRCRLSAMMQQITQLSATQNTSYKTVLACIKAGNKATGTLNAGISKVHRAVVNGF